jgi:molybdopterin-dependent oxidoreductase alpha subunit
MRPYEDPGERELHVSPPPDHAAGLRAVVASMRLALREMGPARTLRTLTKVNQREGFDCMGCAWPDPEQRHHVEFCENGAKAVAEEATRLRAGPELFAQYSIDQLAAQSDFWIGKRGRLTHPLHRAPGATHYAPIGWDDACGLITEELQRLDSPNEAAFYTSGRTSNEAAFAYQAMVRAFGTNNLPDCSNMCHESSGVALTQTIGIGKGSVTLEDIHAADLLIVVGQNPGTNHPRMLLALDAAKERGARIVSINPLREAGLIRFDNPQTARGLLGRGTALADLHLPIRINGDLALFAALNRILIEDQAVDGVFIAEHCEGFEALRDHLRHHLDEAEIARATGLTGAQLRGLAELVKSSERTVVCWAMGLTQHRNAVATIREIVNTLLLRGMIGKPGAGLCPVRGHSNVQGDRTMGIWERPTGGFLDRMEQALKFPMPREHGVDVVEAIKAMRDGRIKVLMALGGNFLSAAPDTAATAAALRNTRLTVHVATKPNRAHLVTGAQALLLPTLGRTERDQPITVEDSMSHVHVSSGTLSPASDQLRSEVRIVCELAQRLLGDTVPIPWMQWARDYDPIRDAIARAVPGFEDFNARRDGGFTLPHPPRDERRFPTASGKAQLTVNPLEVLDVPAGRLLLQTIRSHDQYNTTIYGLNDRYRGIRSGRRVVLVNPDDLAALGLHDGAIVDLVGEDNRRAERFRCVAYDTPRGCAAAYFPEANAVVALDEVAAESGTPVSKSVLIALEPTEDRARTEPQRQAARSTNMSRSG